jgi:spermidine synthase
VGTAVFAGTLFLSAALLFCVQPMVARLLLPLLGGAPAVWNACMVFFQALLLAGYLYAHASLRWLGERRQPLLHLILLLAPLPFLPLTVDAGGVRAWAGDPNPIAPLLGVLLVSVGVPFFVLSASAPLLQRWFFALGAPRARDPYFLYAASNAGSMLALLAYPVVLEPLVGLHRQTELWALGYVAFVVAMGGVALFTAARAVPATSFAEPAPPLAWRRRVRWLALAFVPSSLLLGVTTHVSTDVAAMPLFWVVPLAVYLGTFILVFATRPPVSHALMVRLLPFLVTVTAVVLVSDIADPLWAMVGIHLGTFACAAMVCHGELARDRPHPAHLTEFYLWLALGGVLGGLFNSLVAPVVFAGVAEYPLALVLAALCRPGERARALLVPLVLGVATVAVVLAAKVAGLPPRLGPLLFALPLFANYVLGARRPVRFALGLGAILLAATLHPGRLGETLVQTRNFFGVLRVTRDPGGEFVQIVHGRTVHGRQSTRAGARRVPLAYYHPTGPAGDVFAVAAERMPEARIAVVGLGAGALATYARPGQVWTFYEINSAVAAVATDRQVFSFLHDAFDGDGRRESIVLGDARLRLADVPPASYDVLVLDAFSSDAIPAHLLTREAVELYARTLRPGGMIAAHVSNRFVDLVPVLATVARATGLAAFVRDDRAVPPELLAAGKSPSTWVALVREARDAEVLARRHPEWTRIAPGRAARPWTDDYTDLLGALNWF